MTRFENDLEKVKKGYEIEVITRRKAEIKKLEKELRGIRNRFRAEMIISELKRLKGQLKEIENLF